MPVLERDSHDADGRASDRELAILAGEIAPRGVLPDGFLQAWVNTGQDHRVVLAAGSKRMPRREGSGRETAGSDLQKTASTEAYVEHRRTAGAGCVMINRIPPLPFHLIPPGIRDGEPGRSLRAGQGDRKRHRLYRVRIIP